MIKRWSLPSSQNLSFLKEACGPLAAKMIKKKAFQTSGPFKIDSHTFVSVNRMLKSIVLGDFMKDSVVKKSNTRYMPR